MIKYTIRIRSFFLHALCCLMMGLLSACASSSSGGTPGYTTVSVGLGQAVAAGALAAPGTIPATVLSFSVTAINAAGKVIAGPVTATLPQASVTLVVPNGTGISFQLLAYDAAGGLGKVIYRGTTAPQNLNGQQVSVPVQLNLDVSIMASTMQVVQGGSINLTGLVAGLAPPATSPLLWTSTGGTLSNLGVNGASSVWTASSANTIIGQSYTITAQIDPALNPQQNPAIKGQVTVMVVAQANITGFAMGGNIFSVNNVTTTIDSYGNAAAATALAAQPLNISFQFRDYYTAINTAASYTPVFKFDVREAPPGTRLAVGTISPVIISTTATGQVSVSVPVAATLNYSGRSAAGTLVNGIVSNATANVITTSATTGVVTLDVNALMKTIANKSLGSMNIFATAGVFNYDIGFDSVSLGHENPVANGMDRLNDTGINTGTRGLRGQLIVQ